MSVSEPFLYGAQYYRAPTPDDSCWTGDLRRMRELGMNNAKFWPQWRWAHRRDRFVWDDLDRLFDLAHAEGLGVTLNTVFDVAPVWLYERFPDAKPVRNDGRVIEPYTVGHRQIGGHPGPCYNHPGARIERQRYMTACVERFRSHPAMRYWDVWNEPELCFPQRNPDLAGLACYCANCQTGFRGWLVQRYGTIGKLNAVWGRCYDAWDEVEVPRNPHTITDFIDWRMFHVATMTAEATWRLDLVKRLDPAHPAYLHVVPNNGPIFNTLGCATDDHALAKACDGIFAASMNGQPIWMVPVASAGAGGVLWNVESHVNGGQTTMHQGQRTLSDLLHDWVPQIGLGTTGFLFWQFRAEVLGLESPAWGVVRPDGSDRPVTKAAADFRRLLGDHADALTRCSPQQATVGIWHSQENELFSWSVHGSLDHFNAGQQAWLDLAWARNLPVAFIPSCLALGGTGLESLRVLVMPSPYLLGQAEADALAAWVEAGGVLITEAHLGAYDRDRGRHSTTVPGLGLAARFGIRESESMSTWHLPVERSAAFATATDDVKKMLAGGAAGGKHVPIRLADGTIAWGALRYAELDAPQAEVLGRFAETPNIVASRVGTGLVIYVGTDLGVAAGQGRAGQGRAGQGRAGQGRAGMEALFDRALAAAGLEATAKASGARVSLLHQGGELRYVTVVNPDNAPREFSADLPRLQGVFTGERWTAAGRRTLPPRFAELFAVAR